MKKKDWFKPGNIIALVTLIVTAIGVWGGIKFFNNTQEINAGEECEVKYIGQTAQDGSNSSQKINCGKGAKIERVKQK